VNGDTPEEPSPLFSSRKDLESRLRKLERSHDRAASLEERVKRIELENRECSEDRLLAGASLRRVEEHLAEDRVERKEIHEDVQKIKSSQRAFGLTITAAVAVIPIVIEVVKIVLHK